MKPGFSQSRALGRLMFYAALILVAGFVYFALTLWQSIYRDATTDLHYVDQLLVQTTREVFHHHESVLGLLGDRLLEIGALERPQTGRRLIERMLETNPGMAAFGLARPDGQLVLVSGVPHGRELPNLLDTEASAASFLESLEGTRMVIGRTYYLPVLESWVIPIRVPIRDRHDEVVAVMAAGIALDSRHTTWNAVSLPATIDVRLMRHDGYWQYVARAAPGQKSAFYDTKSNAAVVRDLAGKLPEDNLIDAFLGDDGEQRLGVTSALTEQRMRTLVSLPWASLRSAYLHRLAVPLAIVVLVIASGYGFYRTAASRQRDYESRLIHGAHHDDLTGLPNRVLLMDRLNQALAIAARGQWHVAVFFLDLDQFKRVNDSYGHAAGDQLLQQCAERLQRILRSGDTVGRLGGDEFLLVFPDLQSAEAAEHLASRLLRLFAEPFELGERTVYNTASIGIAVHPQDGHDAGELLRNADTALYRSKDAGRNSFAFFTPGMNDEVQRRIEIDTALRQALPRRELSLRYQPQVDMVSGDWTGAEALLRWHHPVLGEVSPAEFIPVAEESGLIHEIGWFVLETGLRDVQGLIDQAPDFRLSINVSARQFTRAGFIDRLAATLDDCGVGSHNVEIEVTESVLADEAAAGLENLRQLGIGLAVDDFGTGFSSLSYLKRFPVTTLKIDRSFVRDLETDPADAAVSTAIIAMAGQLGLHTIAEGVELVSQADFLTAKGCHVAQGYLYGRPMPIGELREKLAENARLRRSA